jgi:hypothetical protein
LFVTLLEHASYHYTLSLPREEEEIICLPSFVLSLIKENEKKASEASMSIHSIVQERETKVDL